MDTLKDFQFFITIRNMIRIYFKQMQYNDVYAKKNHLN